MRHLDCLQVCYGNSRLYVYENQHYYGNDIEFQAAAPTILTSCVRAP